MPENLRRRRRCRRRHLPHRRHTRRDGWEEAGACEPRQPVRWARSQPPRRGGLWWGDGGGGAERDGASDDDAAAALSGLDDADDITPRGG